MKHTAFCPKFEIVISKQQKRALNGFRLFTHTSIATRAPEDISKSPYTTFYIIYLCLENLHQKSHLKTLF
jgi:hypothetical protein